MLVTIVDNNILNQGKVEESILVKSFKEYKQLGGEKTEFQMYHNIRQKAESLESRYSMAMDMLFSGLPEATEEGCRRIYNQLQVSYLLLNLWFNEPIKKPQW